MTIILPRLINEIIGWYQWKAKIREFNQSFLSLIDQKIEDEDGREYCIQIRRNQPTHGKYIKLQVYGYRDLNMRYYQIDQFVRNREYSSFNVGLLPINYYYSSGSCNQKGFLPKKSSKSNWLSHRIP